MIHFIKKLNLSLLLGRLIYLPPPKYEYIIFLKKPSFRPVITSSNGSQNEG